MEEHYRKLENMYLSAKSQQFYYETLTILISDKKAVLTLEVSEKYFHSLNAIHGSVYFKLLDDACFFAVNSIVPDIFVLTTGFNINIVRPVSEGKITAIATVKNATKNLFIAEATMYNSEGKTVAFGTGTFMKSKLLLTEQIGYK